MEQKLWTKLSFAVKIYLTYKETTLSKNLHNISCKQLSSLYTELHERRLPETQIHIINKQSLSFLTIIMHHLHFVSTTTNIHYLPQPFDHPNDSYNMATPHYQPNRQNDKDGQRRQCKHTKTIWHINRCATLLRQ